MGGGGAGAAGVVNQVVLLGQLPWISLVLAATFGCYGLFRKQIPVDAADRPAGRDRWWPRRWPSAYLVLPRAAPGRWSSGTRGRAIDALLVLLGVVTAVPLMLFAAGAQRLRLVTVGFLQYLAPSMTFLLAVFVFGEPLGAARITTFALIWAGILVYFRGR